LRSKSGKYYVAQKKFQFLTAVTITNPSYVIKSNHLVTIATLVTYLFGPSTITRNNYIYTEKDFMIRRKIYPLSKKSYIKYDGRLIGDSLYYDRNQNLSALNVKNGLRQPCDKGPLCRNIQKQDSLFVTKRAVAVLCSKRLTRIFMAKGLWLQKKRIRIIRIQ
jgi:hypothetical protein